MKITAKLLERGNEKHYGTRIQLVDEDGDEIGNPIKVWYCSGDEKPDGDAAPSERETGDDWRYNDHYESVADLEVARFIVDAINEKSGK